jgi:TonB family protein
MTRTLLLLFALTLCFPVSGQQMPEPVLRDAHLPWYPVMARLARVSGDVEASFVVDANGDVTSVNIASGHELLRKETGENIQTWKFTLPRGSNNREWKCETTFHYRLLGITIGKTPTKHVVSIDTFHNVEVAVE